MAFAKLAADPVIIGILSASRPPRAWVARLERACKKYDRRAVCLTFEVKARYLKNTIACMRLMDIKALVLYGRHRKAMAKLVPHLSPLAKRNQTVDVIVRRGGKFVGAMARGDDLLALLQDALR